MFSKKIEPRKDTKGTNGTKESNGFSLRPSRPSWFAFLARLEPELERRDGFVPSRPFSDVATPLQTFARPNDAANPVVVFELKKTQ